MEQRQRKRIPLRKPVNLLTVAQEKPKEKKKRGATVLHRINNFVKGKNLPVTYEIKQRIGALVRDKFFNSGKKNTGAYKRKVVEAEGEFMVMYYPSSFIAVIDVIISNYYKDISK